MFDIEIRRTFRLENILAESFLFFFLLNIYVNVNKPLSKN